MIGIGPYAQVSNMILNPGPAVGYAWRNNDHVAYVYVPANEISVGLAAAGGAVQDLGDVALRAGPVAIEDCATGNERTGAGNDLIGFELLVMRDQSGRAQLRALRRGGRSALHRGRSRSATTTSGPARAASTATGCTRRTTTRSTATATARTSSARGLRGPAIDDADGDVVLARYLQF